MLGKEIKLIVIGSQQFLPIHLFCWLQHDFHLIHQITELFFPWLQTTLDLLNNSAPLFACLLAFVSIRLTFKVAKVMATALIRGPFLFLIKFVWPQLKSFVLIFYGTTIN